MIRHFENREQKRATNYFDKDARTQIENILKADNWMIFLWIDKPKWEKYPTTNDNKQPNYRHKNRNKAQKQSRFIAMRDFNAVIFNRQFVFWIQIES